MMRLKSDIVPFTVAVLRDQEPQPLIWGPRPAVCITTVVEGYAQAEKLNLGEPIYGLDKLKGIPDFKIFHAGTRREGKNVVTAGGRVLNHVAVADTVEAANIAASNATHVARFRGQYRRWDIGDTRKPRPRRSRSELHQ